MNGKGEALLTYRRADGRLRRVLAWGAINARAPSAEVPQVRFRWDYAGGWGSTERASTGGVQESLRPYDGPPPMLVAACKAPNGTYWTVQAWQRRLPLLGFDPWLPHQTNWEFHVAHFAGELPRLELHPNWTYDGRWQGVFGRYSYLGQPVFGYGSTAKGVPKDKYGRNLYIDTLNSAYGPGGGASRASSPTEAPGRSATASFPSGRSPAIPARRSGRQRRASGIASPSAGRA